ncbi:hypothetical protein Q428_11065 [Fervidicella metallireducens AeB]|uniref:DUF2202 domain-containing protein n=1 Tax=Fervidicella metallireducens AeB TaxID=1403537 RepID=A0A017RTA6_9CLOT|nr:DUF2202 domain-containing protein [Fervidicella metallireducens]EYE87846.1 hypothetical protein Q428_11065 [Fervidicella metallireducens AeB]
MLYGAKAAKSDNSLTLEKMLKYAIEDEYLARQEYEIAISQFGDEKPFPNIINSEVNHINWLKGLFEKYNFQIPVDEAHRHLDSPGNFIHSLDLGVEAEIENIEMYERFLLEEIPDDVREVFTKLRDASKGHLFVLKKRLESM